MTEPYWTSDGSSIYLGDCLKVLPQLGPVDMVLTDPPYSSGGMFRGDRATRKPSEKYQQSGTKTTYPEFTGDNLDQHAWMLWQTFVWRQLWGHLPSGGFFACFTDWRQLPTLSDVVQMAGFCWRGVAVWDKTEAARPVLGRPRAQCEFIVWGTKGGHTPAGDALPGCFRQSVLAEPKTHVTQKPVAVCKWLLGMCPRGGVVLDPFCGSGTTLRAAQETGRKSIGIEISEEIADLAIARMEESLQVPLLRGDG